MPEPKPLPLAKRAPELRVVREDEHVVVEERRDPTEVVVRPAAEVGAPEIEPRPPLSYRVGAFAAQLAGERQPSVSERFEYSMHGDWTAAGPNHPVRHGHLILGSIGVIAFALPGALLIWVGLKPARWITFVVMLILLGLIVL